MNEIRPARTADAPCLTRLLTQLGYPSELDAVARRLTGILPSVTQQVLVAADGSRIDGYVSVERRSALHDDERAEITGLVVDAAARRSGLGRALVAAAEQWARQQNLHTIVVRSNVVRPESHLFYAGIGYVRTSTSHTYRKDSTTTTGRA
ncbi:GNAT family N-acetyltransferase [Amycolatopsis sp. NPDC051128]|uniref:GNAT family N-acetyltransferase n=1 Tax=Amycolatopsis sp. NPDC051128 TaxID=3155412 RepID=UPI0034283DA9